MGGNKVRVRQYPWGTVESELSMYFLRGHCHEEGSCIIRRGHCHQEGSCIIRSGHVSGGGVMSCILPFSVENEAHCDFVKLREMMIR